MSDESILGGETGASEGAAPADWKSSLPEDIRGEASLADIKDIASLAKGYVHAQKMIGVEKLPAPKENWTQEQWGEFWGKLGRPEAPDKYPIPKIDGVEVNQDAIKPYLDRFHELGLTKKQGEELLGMYMKDQVTAQQKMVENAQTSLKAAQDALKTEWGDNYDTNVETAVSFAKQVMSDDLLNSLEKAGIANNVEFVKLMHKIGRSMAEDDAKATGVQVSMPARSKAAAEIGTLRMDSDFMKALTDRSHVGHNAAIQKWEMLHKMAFNDEKVQAS